MKRNTLFILTAILCLYASVASAQHQCRRPADLIRKAENDLRKGQRKAEGIQRRLNLFQNRYEKLDAFFQKRIDRLAEKKARHEHSASLWDQRCAVEGGRACTRTSRFLRRAAKTQDLMDRLAAASHNRLALRNSKIVRLEEKLAEQEARNLEFIENLAAREGEYDQCISGTTSDTDETDETGDPGEEDDSGGSDEGTSA